MFEGDFAHTCSQNFASVDGGLSRVSHMDRHGSEDPHWRQRKFYLHYHDDHCCEIRLHPYDLSKPPTSLPDQVHFLLHIYPTVLKVQSK